eukprot:jgi/Tetstr1/446629/TSEL_034152.t1
MEETLLDNILSPPGTKQAKKHRKREEERRSAAAASTGRRRPSLPNSVAYKVRQPKMQGRPVATGDDHSAPLQVACVRKGDAVKKQRAPDGAERQARAGIGPTPPAATRKVPEESTKSEPKPGLEQPVYGSTETKPEQLLVGVIRPAALALPNPVVELRRQEAVQRLQRAVENTCRKLRVRYVNKLFENWILQSPAQAKDNTLTDDPVLSGPASCPDRLAEGLRTAGAPPGPSAAAAKQLCQQAQAAMKDLLSFARRGEGTTRASEISASDSIATGKKARQALIERCGNKAALRGKELHLGQVKLRVNEEHLEKLRLLYKRHGPAGASDSDFLRAVFCLIVRYNTLQGGSCHGGGMQAALTEEAFDVLHQVMGTTMECFASPLNCFWGRFCSAFLDTDSPFGSVGSFFSFRPAEGSFEANPPFEPVLMKRMVEHMHDLLKGAEGPMSFVVIIPAWEHTAGWQALQKSTYLTEHVRVAQKDHGFCQARWPPSDAACDAIRAAMRSKHCTVAQQMAAKQAERQQPGA